MTEPKPPEDAERVLSQALRAMVGGRETRPAGRAVEPDTRLTTLQVLLVAVIIGLFVGMAAGITTLLLR